MIVRPFLHTHKPSKTLALIKHKQVAPYHFIIQQAHNDEPLSTEVKEDIECIETHLELGSKESSDCCDLSLLVAPSQSRSSLRAPETLKEERSFAHGGSRAR